MKKIFKLALGAGLAAVVTAESVVPQMLLPQWSEEDKAKLSDRELAVGLALLTESELENEGEQKPEEVVIEAVEEQPSPECDKKLEKDSEIAGVYLDRYFGSQPKQSLVDPQELLSMQERADLQHALWEHKEQSEVAIYVYLFDAEQRLDRQHSPRNVYDSLFLDNSEPIVIVYYFLGAPQRSRFMLAGGAGDAVEEWQVRELLWNAAYKAEEKSESFDQLDDFIGQLSMRLFWLEEMMLEMSQAVEPKAQVPAAKPESARTDIILGFWENSVKTQLLNIVISVSSAVLVLLYLVYLALSRRYYFPDITSPARLGGDIGGSHGGVLSYKTHSVPPSEQKKQIHSDFF